MFETILTSHVRRFQYKHVKIFLNDWTQHPFLVNFIRAHINLKAFGEGLNEKNHIHILWLF
jgi:hypothetical protein